MDAISGYRKGDSPMNDKQKILVADDELYIRLLVKDILEPEFTVIEASNGEEAVSAARAEQPDMVLMDILMLRHQEQRANQGHPRGHAHRRRPRT